MARYFTLSTDPIQPEETRAFQEKIESCAWWHWLPNYWLIVDPQEQLTASVIVDHLHAINPRTRALALQIERIEWAALTRPDEQGKDMAGWLRRTWGS